MESREREIKYNKWEMWNKLEETSPNLYVIIAKNVNRQRSTIKGIWSRWTSHWEEGTVFTTPSLSQTKSVLLWRNYPPPPLRLDLREGRDYVGAKTGILLGMLWWLVTCLSTRRLKKDQVAQEQIPGRAQRTTSMGHRGSGAYSGCLQSEREVGIPWKPGLELEKQAFHCPAWILRVAKS